MCYCDFIDISSNGFINCLLVLSIVKEVKSMSGF